jgi:hypothetical protein
VGYAGLSNVTQHSDEIAVSSIKAILYFLKYFIINMAEITKQPLAGLFLARPSQ